jgi:hypothetical protein
MLGVKSIMHIFPMLLVSAAAVTVGCSTTRPHIEPYSGHYYQYGGPHFSSVRVAEGIAYVGVEGVGLRTIDVSNPAAPVELSTLSSPTKIELSFFGHLFTAEPLRLKYFVADVVGEIAYVIVKPSEGRAGLPTLWTVDVSNPASPQWLGSIERPRWSYLWTPGKVKVIGSIAYVLGRENLWAIDVSNPKAPVELGAFKLDITRSRVVSWGCEDLDVADGVAYVACGDDGFYIIDVSNPASPVELSSFAFERPIWRRTYFAFACGLKLSGPLLYVADKVLGLLVFDVSNPASPVLLTIFREPGAICAIDVKGTIAYALGAGLQIIDVADPSAPVQLATSDLSCAGAGGGWRQPRYESYGDDSDFDLEVVEGIVYAADSSSGLHVIDVSNPASPVELSLEPQDP